MQANKKPASSIIRLVLFTFLAVSLLLAGCGPSGSAGTASGPRVWIDAPFNGDAFVEDIGTLIIYSHASTDGGAVEAELYVDGELQRIDSATASSDELVLFEQPWTPPGPGLYQIEVRAVAEAGPVGPPATILVQVGGEVVRLTEGVTPEPVVTGCPVPDENSKLYLNELAGYCFLYPSDHNEREPASDAPATTIIQGPPPAGGGEGLTTFFSVTIEDAAGRTTEQYIADKIDAAKAPGTTPSENPFSLDGEDAVWTEELPSQAGARIGYLVHNDQGFALALIPDGGDATDLNARAEQLWTTITTTWQWLDDSGGTPTVSPTADAGAEDPEGSLNSNANCRRGPGTEYDVVTSLTEGTIVALDGRNDFAPPWWYIVIPGSSAHCWVSDSIIDISGPVDDLPIIAAPPLPSDTPIATPTATPTATPAPVPPDAPDNLSVSDSCTGSGLDVTLSWSDNSANESGFRVYRDGSLLATLSANTTSYSESAPHTNTGYSYAVEAFNSVGSSGQASANSSVCPVP